MKEIRIIIFAIQFFNFCCLAQSSDETDLLPKYSKAAFEIFLSKPDSAIAISKKILEHSLVSKNKYYEGYSYFLLSKAYWVKANYRLSTEYGFKALRNFENSNYKSEWVLSLLSVARTLVELGNYGKADELIGQALRISRDERNELLLAEAYREKSYVLSEKHELDSALLYADKGIILFEHLGDSLDASILYGRKARIYLYKKDYKQSREYAYRGLLLDTLVGNRRALGISYYIAAQNEQALNNFAKAEQLLKHSIRINKEIGNLMWLGRAYELLARLYLTANNTQAAAAHLLYANQTKDSLYNTERNGQIQEMQSLYELETKENTIKLLEKENALRNQESKTQRLFVAFLLVGVLLMALLLFFLTRLRRIQIKTNQHLTAKNIAIELQKQELQVQAEKLQEFNQLQTKLFSVISHDLRGPIGNLHGLLELFTKKLMTADEMVEISNKLKSNLSVTQRTLENLLNWALSQMDGIKTDRRRINTKEIIGESCDLMQEAAGRKNVTISKSVDESIFVLADPDQIQLVLRNLIHNGIKFSKIGDTLSIFATREENVCRITIIDTGIGISQEEVNMIVGSQEHFTKVGTQQEKGTGLGLLLCKEFIERNGGTFHFKSNLGEGSEVSFTLDLA